MAVVLHVVGGHGGVGDPVVHHRVHRHRHRVPGEHLQQAWNENRKEDDALMSSLIQAPSSIPPAAKKS